jgi:hypothetical protein
VFLFVSLSFSVMGLHRNPSWLHHINPYTELPTSLAMISFFLLFVCWAYKSKRCKCGWLAKEARTLYATIYTPHRPMPPRYPSHSAHRFSNSEYSCAVLCFFRVACHPHALAYICYYTLRRTCFD